MTQSEDPSVSELTAREQGTVLLADDEPVVRRVARLTLQQLGFAVVVAADGAEALRLFEEHAASIVLVLLDLSMPGLGGLETLEAIRAQAPDLPAILSSGHGEMAVSPDERTLFLPKPYRIQQLEELVRRLLGE